MPVQQGYIHQTNCQDGQFRNKDREYQKKQFLEILFDKMDFIDKDTDIGQFIYSFIFIKNSIDQFVDDILRDSWLQMFPAVIGYSIYNLHKYPHHNQCQ